MPFSKESVDYYALRKNQLENLKKHMKIGVFGSFYGTRKSDLISLQQFLHSNGYIPRISSDLDTRKGTGKKEKDSLYDRKLSEELINDSDIHLFILVLEKDDEPSNLIQSVSMEIEHLNTLHRCGRKSAKYVAVYAENGLIGTMGSVCEGLLVSKKGDWVIEEFNDIQEIFKPARQFCPNCILDMYDF